MARPTVNPYGDGGACWGVKKRAWEKFEPFKARKAPPISACRIADGKLASPTCREDGSFALSRSMDDG